MTENTFAAKVTEIIDATTGGFEYPDSFDSDVHACFQNRMTPEDAADKLLSEWQD